MEISSFLLRIIFLSIPGIFTSLIYDKLIRRKSKKDWEDILKIILFSLISYFFLYLIIFLLNKFSISTYHFHTYEAIFDEKSKLPANEIISATMISCVFAFIFAYISHNNWINRIGQKLNVTNLFSDNDVWEDFFDQNKRWVFVRDEIRKLIYYGYIILYSESDKNREIVMKDVEVYDDRIQDTKTVSSPLYKLESIYLSRNVDYITIEIPIHDEEKND